MTLEKPTSVARSGLPYRADLQALRGLAILLVVLHHAGVSALSGGYIGVDVFFVLSGFLITGIILRRCVRADFSLSAFYLRRIRRLMPALAVMVLSTALAAKVLLLPSQSDSLLGSAAYALLWISNVFFTFRELDYFDETMDQDLFLHTWSLGVEEQFYLVWPVLVLVAFAVWSRNRGPRACFLSAALLIGVGLCSFLLSLFWTATWPNAAFYMMPSRIWQFAVGGTIAWLLFINSRGPEGLESPYGNSWASSGALAGILLIVFSSFWLDGSNEYPGWYALLPTAGAGLLIACGLNGRGFVQRIFVSPWLIWIGDRSYSLYLWHWPVFMLALALGLELSLFSALALLLVSVVVADASYRWIEIPFWKGELLANSPIRFLSGAALLVFLVVGVLRVDFHSFLDEDARIAEVQEARADLPELYARGCDDFNRSAELEPCRVGNGEYSKTALVVGDSIGLQWISAFERELTPHGWRLLTLTKSACPIVAQPVFNDRLGGRYINCENWRGQLAPFIANLRPELLVIGSSLTYGFSATEWIVGTRDFLEDSHGSAGAVLILNGTPTPGFNGPNCLAEIARSGNSWAESDCRRSPSARHSEVGSYLTQAAESFPNVFVADLAEIACPDGYCRALYEGDIVFRDGSHLTDSYVRARSSGIFQRILHRSPPLRDLIGSH